MRRGLVVLALLLVCPTVWAMRTRKPAIYTDLSDRNQLSDLNTYLSELHELTNGRYTLENITTDPNGSRKGVKGDLVYATFGSNDHLCVNTSFPAGTAWTCINIGTLSTCPGGFDTNVQFNDVGTCGGEQALIYDRNLNHAALDGDGTATVDGAIVEDADTGSTTSTQVLSVKESLTDFTNARKYAFLGDLTWAPASATVGNQDVRGVGGIVRYTGSGLIQSSSLYGVYGQATYEGTKVGLNNPIYFAGVAGLAEQNGSTRIQDIYGGYFNAGTTLASTGIATRVVGVEIGDLYKNGSGTISDSVGIEIFNTNDIATENFGVIANIGVDDFNIFSGLTSFGDGSGTWYGDAVLHTRTSNLSSLTSQTPQTINLKSEGSTLTLSSGTTIASMLQNQFLAPTLNGVAGGATETVTNAATVYISDQPKGSNITFANASHSLWVDGTTDGTVSGILVSNSQANSAGSTNEVVTIDFGFGSDKDVARMSVSKYGDYVTNAPNQASRMQFSVDVNGVMTEEMRLSQAGAAIRRTTDDSNNELVVNGSIAAVTSASAAISAIPTGTIFARGVGVSIGDDPDPSDVAGSQLLLIRGTTGSTTSQVVLDSRSASGCGGAFRTQVDSTTRGTLDYCNSQFTSTAYHWIFSQNFDPTGVTAEIPLIVFGDMSGANDTITLSSGTTVADQRFNIFAVNSINGIAGGGTETVTNAATVYIEAAPTGTDITFTNGPYALWVDDGTSRFDAAVEVNGAATVSGILTANSGIVLDSPANTGGCLMLRDTDDAGWTKCTALNGTLSCVVDGDGVC